MDGVEELGCCLIQMSAEKLKQARFFHLMEEGGPLRCGAKTLRG